MRMVTVIDADYKVNKGVMMQYNFFSILGLALLIGS